MCVPRCVLLVTLLVSWLSLPASGEPSGSAPPVWELQPAEAEIERPASATEPSTVSGRPILLLSVYCLLIIAASLLGGWLPSLVELTHNRVQMLISLIGGLMLGIGVFQMLPHALHELGPAGTNDVALWMMAGIVAMFMLLRAFHFHEHEPQHVCGHDHDHDHDHGTIPAPDAGRSTHQLSWVGVFFGLGLHTLIDGVALGVSVLAGASRGAFAGLFGLGTFAAILLHKPLDAVSITSLMTAGQWSAASRLLVNGAFALMCPLGVVLFVLGLDRFADQQSLIVGQALAFSAGVFICISLSDLLPEMELHSHNRLRLTVLLLLGIAMAWGLHLLEPSHLHP